MSEQEHRRTTATRWWIVRRYQEVTGSISYTCRYGGIGRPTFDT
jgi:hypothetical protein